MEGFFKEQQGEQFYPYAAEIVSKNFDWFFEKSIL